MTWFFKLKFSLFVSDWSFSTFVFSFEHSFLESFSRLLVVLSSATALAFFRRINSTFTNASFKASASFSCLCRSWEYRFTSCLLSSAIWSSFSAFDFVNTLALYNMFFVQLSSGQFSYFRKIRLTFVSRVSADYQHNNQQFLLVILSDIIRRFRSLIISIIISDTDRSHYLLFFSWS